MKKRSFQYPRRIMVEGVGDKHVVLGIMKKMAIRSDVDVEEKDGIGNLIEAVPGLIPKRSKIKALGIVVDANDDLDGRWEQLRTPLEENGYKFPDTPRLSGTTLRAPERPRVGIWLMPDNKSPGEIENFAAKMVPVGNPLWEYANNCVKNIPSGQKKFRLDRIQRVTMRVWLAMLPEPNYMGSAIVRGDLSVNAPLCQKFGAWLSKFLN